MQVGHACMSFFVGTRVTLHFLLATSQMLSFDPYNKGAIAGVEKLNKIALPLTNNLLPPVELVDG